VGAVMTESVMMVVIRWSSEGYVVCESRESEGKEDELGDAGL
jgi:hypothetical protein